MTWTYFLYGYVLLPLMAIAYLAIGVWLVFRVGRKPTSWMWRIGVATVTALALLAVPSADVVIGRIEFARLCNEEARVSVFRTVSLDKKYLRADGSPRMEQVVGHAGYRIGPQYTMTSFRDEVLTWPRVERVRVEIRDSSSGEVLGEVVNYRYWGGWLSRQLPGHRSAEGCAQLRDRTSLERLVFRSTDN